MSVTLARDMSFLGMPLVTVRDVLRAWRRGDRSDSWRIAERQDIALDPRTVFVLLEELRDRGLIGPVEQEWGRPIEDLTEAGLALVGASARKRTAKARALKILDRFLNACAAVNARNDLPFEVREVWLFGSMIDDARDDVADIDVVALYGEPERYDRTSAMKHFRELAEAMGATWQSGLVRIFGSEAFVHRQLLHGGRRHPLMSMHDLEELRDLGCPCRLVFDAARGGRITNPILAQHPASPGKSNRVGDRKRLPDLAAGRGPLRPLDAKLMACRHRDYARIRALGPWPAGDPCYAIMDDVRMPIVVVDGAEPPELKPNALKKRARFPSCDGRNRFGLWFTDLVQIDPNDWRSGYETIPMAMAVIERAILREGDRVHYRIDVIDADHHGQAYDFAHLLMLEWWLHLTITTDVDRIVRREIEEGVRFDVEVTVANTADKRIAAGLQHTPRLFDRPYVEEVRARVAGSAMIE